MIVKIQKVEVLEGSGLGYLMKYVSKSLDIGIEAGIRRIGSSQIAGYLRRSWSKLSSAISFFLGLGESFDSLSKNYDWNWKGASVRVESRHRLWCFIHPKTAWQRVTSFDDALLFDSSF
ncbi:MAG: hypothetical protein Q8N12_02675 [Thermodesulfovibrionales bacterium]|nr:hypothetical protein [Thermodesulfovibrionales bacterium]